MTNQTNKLVLFESRQIRRIWHGDEWYYSVVDVIEALTESPTPRQYWGKVKQREFVEIEVSPIWVQLKLEAPDGKLRLTDCVNTKSALRLIQSIPSKKAEPFKMWLAQVGKERIDEIKNPELAQERMKLLYEKKGYPKDWIDKRLRGMAIRQNLTDEWKERGLVNQREYAILTAEISKATFGMTPSEYRKLKKIPKESKSNLRDNMTDLELIFAMLGERVTTEISQKEKPDSFDDNQDVAKRGGGVAGVARKETEKELGESIVSEENYLGMTNEFNQLESQNNYPQIIKDVGFDFDWDEQKVWALDIPVTKMSIDELIWHFDIPFLWEGGEIYNLKPQEVIDNPDKHPEEYRRTMEADTTHPIDIMENKGRWLILDGLHRLMKASMEGLKEVVVRIVPRDKINEITK